MTCSSFFHSNQTPIERTVAIVFLHAHNPIFACRSRTQTIVFNIHYLLSKSEPTYTSYTVCTREWGVEHVHAIPIIICIHETSHLQFQL